MKINDSMGVGDRAPLSRRQWLKRIPLSAFAFLGGAKLVGQKRPDIEAKGTTASESHRGVGVYNVRDYGAKGDGTALDTAAVQAAIDACSRDGGGTVVVPAGVFQVGTLELKSNVTFHIAAAGKILGSADGKQYHAVNAIPLSGDATLDDGNWALIFAVDGKNITVEGPGTIDGQGAQFYSHDSAPPPSGLGGLDRPYHLLFYRCENLTVRNLSLLESAYHSIRVIQSKRVHMDHLYIHNRVNGNNDGFHFISAEYVTVSNCTVQSQDDACALFGSCKYITVTNSSFSTRWSVFRFGDGVAENIAVSNCLLHHVYGCPIKFQGNAGSRFENMSFANLVLDDVTGPIHISVGPQTDVIGTIGGVPQSPSSPPVLRNVSFSNITGTVTTNPPSPPFPGMPNKYFPGEQFNCITLNSVGDSILENISFDNIHLTFGGGGTAQDAERRDLPLVAGEYFALGTLPAYGLYARHVRGLTLQNVRFQVSRPDLRPAVIFDHVVDGSIIGLAAEGNPQAESVLRFRNSQDVLLSACRVLQQASVFLQVEGAESHGIVLDGGDLRKAKSALAFKDGAATESVRERN